MSERSEADVVSLGAVRGVIASSRVVFAQERGLTALGVAGLGISLVCLVGVATRGTFVPPEGKLLDATTFTFGVAVFTLTIALLLPLAGYSEQQRRRWRVGYSVFPVYGLVLEPVQAFRGLDPRFSLAGGIVDQIAGIVFGTTAVVLTVVFVILGLRFFRSDVLADRPDLRNAIRYGTAAVWLSFGVGIVMSVVQGRALGAGGDLMLSHALGVHGIQAVPLIGLLAVAARRPSLWIHVAGVGWLAACMAALTQALAGGAPFEASLLPAVMAAGLVGVAVVGSMLVVRLRLP